MVLSQEIWKQCFFWNTALLEQCSFWNTRSALGMKPREGEDGYESHPQQAMAMPPQRSSQIRSNPRAGGHGECRSSPPSGRVSESPSEEWGARRRPTRQRCAEATQPWRGRELLLWRAGRSQTCGGSAATASASAQGNDAAGGGAAKDCGLRRDHGQERTMSGKGSERGDISGNNIS